jgi:hypothetical protein
VRVDVAVGLGVILPVGVEEGVLVKVTAGFVVMVAVGVREAVEVGPAVPFCPGLGKAETGPSYAEVPLRLCDSIQ